MTNSDFYYYDAIVKKIVAKEIKPELCKVCYPACLEYEFKMFSKKIHVDFISGNKIVSIYGPDYLKFNIVLDLHEIEFYRTNKDLLR
jgi:hypothetical protein